MSTLTAPVSPALRITYPESDGRPMGETEIHVRTVIYVLEALRYFFRQAMDVYVSGNMLLYYEEGEPASVVSPDIFVVKGAHKHERRTYKLWEERLAPTTVFEITSRSTRLDDTGTKKALYAMLGVKEYFIFDPLAEYLHPPLQGFMLEASEYRRITPAADGSLTSLELGLKVTLEGQTLRLVDADTGEKMLTPLEAQEETRRLREELEHLRRQK